MKFIRFILTFLLLVASCLCFINIYNNIKFEKENNIDNIGNTLSSRLLNISHDQLINNKLYQLDDKYIYHGHANNYILFKNDLYRIISLENDGTIKIISNTLYNNSNYEKLYQEEIDNNIIIKNKFNNANYNLAEITDLEDAKNLKEEYIMKYIGELNIKDVVLASSDVYFDEYLDIYFWINKKYNYLYIDDTWNLSNNYYANGDFIKKGNTNNYRPVLYLNKNFLLKSGKGTKNNPYILGELNE